MNDVDIQYLRSAISIAWQARAHGNHPFGAVLVDAEVEQANNAMPENLLDAWPI